MKEYEFQYLGLNFVGRKN